MAPNGGRWRSGGRRGCPYSGLGVRDLGVGATFKTFPPRWAHLRVPVSPPEAAQAALSLYAPCRPAARAFHAVAWRAAGVGGARLLPGRARAWAPPMGDDTWAALVQRWEDDVGRVDAIAVYERPQRARSGVAALLVRDGTGVAFVKVRRGDVAALRRENAVLEALTERPLPGVWTPAPRSLGEVDGWSYLMTTAFRSALHRPARGVDIAALSREIEASLAGVVVPSGEPAHWRPMHGDLTPWNLRDVDGTGTVLIDWEDAALGPPEADATLYAATCAALRQARVVKAPSEAVRFWRDRLDARPANDTDRRFSRLLGQTLDAMATPIAVAPSGDRPRILISAFGCRPRHGSEPEVGFRAVIGAAEQYEVWVLTTPASATALERYLRGHDLADRIHLVAVPLPVPEHRIDDLGLLGFHVAYDIWQRRAGATGIALDADVGFDAVHHVTVAAYWARSGVAVVPKPFVWGPVGGGVEPPLRLLPALGLRGVLNDLARVGGRRLLRRLWPSRQAQRRAVLTFAQNQDTARVLRRSAEVRVLPNATCVEVGRQPSASRRRRDALMIGRLLPWKGGVLAVRALASSRHDDAVLRIFGRGPDRRRITREARRLGIAHRVVFEDQVPREELLAQVAAAGVVLQPSVHEESSLAVAEALSLGTPVVCLDRGGPPQLLAYWPQTPAVAVEPSWPGRTVRLLAEAMDGFLDDPPPIAEEPTPPAARFAAQLNAGYEFAMRVGARERSRA